MIANVIRGANSLRLELQSEKNYYSNISQKNNQFHCPFINVTMDDDSNLLNNKSKFYKSNKAIEYILKETSEIKVLLTEHLLSEIKLNDFLSINYNGFNYHIEKLKLFTLLQNEYKFSNGNFKMNKINLENENCSLLKIIFSYINPYMYDDSSSSVTSTITEIDIQPCVKPSQTSARKKRSVQQQQQQTQTNFSVTLNMKLNDNNVFRHINTTQKYALHFLNTSKELIILSFVLRSQDLLSVLIGYNYRPSADSYNASYTLPDVNKTCSSQFDDEDCEEFKRTVTLRPAKNTTLITVVSCLNCTDKLLNYSIKISYPSCKQWINERWVEGDSCQVSDETIGSKAKFSSNLFGSLGAGLDMAPNLIDFDTVFDDFASKLADNAAVFGTICALCILFIPLAFLARKLDERDKLLWLPQPLLDNKITDTFSYEIHVFTGDKNKADTKSKIQLSCFGMENNTVNRVLESKNSKNFPRNSVKSFVMTCPYSLGNLLCLKVSLNRKKMSMTPYDSWFLSRIIIIDRTAQSWYNFDCENWLSDEIGDCQVERVLVATRTEAKTKVMQLLKRNFLRRLLDDHLWLSVGARRTQSKFTRLQRLAVCFVALFLSMIASCMFYRNSGESKAQAGLTFGPVTFTVYELYVGLASSVIVFPGLIMITLFFNAKRWRKYLVPLGWIITFIAAFTASFFTILYSMQWGKEKSLQWEISFFLSFVQSIVLVQPVKVVIIVFLLTFLFRKDADLTEYEDNIGNMTKLDAEDLSHIPKGNLFY